MIENIEWLGHDSFRITGSMVVYIDPWHLSKGASPADLVLVTHDHYDHLSKADIDLVRTASTVVVGPAEVTSRLKGVNTRTLAPGESVTVAGATITALPAYNTDKFRDKAAGAVFHPREDGKLGFVLELDGRRIYHAGDTDIIPEMAGMDVDVALLPVSGTYVMTWQEAVKACDMLTAGTVIPMHYDAIVGSLRDAQRFAEGCRLPVEILPSTAP